MKDARIYWVAIGVLVLMLIMVKLTQRPTIVMNPSHTSTTNCNDLGYVSPFGDCAH